MRLRSSPLVLGLVAVTASGTMALTSTTAFASSSHSNHGSTKVSVKGNNNGCTIVNSKNVHCTTVSHKRGHGNGNGDRHHGGGILEGVHDILGGLLGAL
jgi:hypothetical protein